MKKGETLFPRIDMAKELAELEADRKAKMEAAAKAEAPKEEKKEETGVVSLIDIGDFAKVELRVAQVTACEPVPKADKLLKLQLDDGMGGRQVVSGIAKLLHPRRFDRQKDCAGVQFEACQASGCPF